MKEVRQHRKEFVKNVRLGRLQDVLSITNKYGISFTSEEGATALMLALHHGQHELALELMKRNASVRQTDPHGWLAIDYLLQGYYKNALLKHQQMASVQTLRQFWHLVKPPGITMEVFNHQLTIGGNSMLFFLVTAMRTMQAVQPNKVKINWPGEDKRELISGSFSMDELMQLASLMPDEILLPYRRNRSYINSIMASNEISRRGQPGCKLVFERVQRGWYILNPNVSWMASR